MNGDLDDSIAQLLACEEPLPLEMVAVNDSFGEIGAERAEVIRPTRETPPQLMSYGGAYLN